jgi:hypothetical protein
VLGDDVSERVEARALDELGAEGGRGGRSSPDLSDGDTDAVHAEPVEQGATVLDGEVAGVEVAELLGDSSIRSSSSPGVAASSRREAASVSRRVSPVSASSPARGTTVAHSESTASSAR